MSQSRSEYFAEHATTLEGELSTVLEMVMSSRPADPALAIAKLLTEWRQAALARPEAAAIDAAIAALGEYKSAFGIRVTYFDAETFHALDYVARLVGS